MEMDRQTLEHLLTNHVTIVLRLGLQLSIMQHQNEKCETHLGTIDTHEAHNEYVATAIDFVTTISSPRH